MRNKTHRTSWIVAVLGMICITACATLEHGSREEAQRRIDLGSYSIENPATGRWQAEIRKERRRVRFVWNIMSNGLAMRATITVSERSWRSSDPSLTLEQVANDQLDREERRMIQEALRKRDHVLKDTKRQLSDVGGKKLYTLHYAKGWENGMWENSILYLYFPDDFMEKDRYYSFSLSLYGGGSPGMLGIVHIGDVHRVIESLEIHP